MSLRFLVASVFCGIASIAFPQSIYSTVLKHSFKGDHQSIIDLEQSILAIPDSPQKNDLLIALGFSYLNAFKYDRLNDVISIVHNPSDLQRGSMHELLGIVALTQQKYKTASVEFQRSLNEFSSHQTKSSYFEACNNLAFVHNIIRDEDQTSNVLLDRVIEYCEKTGDSTLLARALLNKSISYPYNAVYLQQRAFNMGPQSLKSTALFLLGSQKNNVAAMREALALNSYTDYSTPIPLKIVELEEIRISMAKRIQSIDPIGATELLLKALRDTSYLSTPIQNKIFRSLSSVYDSRGFRDSSFYYLNQEKKIEDERDGQVVSLDQPASFESSIINRVNLVYLLPVLAFGIALTVLSYFLIKNLRSA